MPRVWTAERNEMLMLLFIESIKVDTKQMAAAWKAKYPHTDYQPTARAIQEQIGALKRTAGGGSGNGKTASSVPSTPASSKKRPAPKKTPMSSAKRQRTGNMSDDDDDDDDEQFDTPLPKRESIGRSSKTGRAKYVEPEDSDSDGLNAAFTPVSALDFSDLTRSAHSPNASAALKFEHGSSARSKDGTAAATRTSHALFYGSKREGSDESDLQIRL